MENNTITHIEIPAPALNTAVEFYSKLFNWQIEIIPPGDYALFKIGSTQTGGGFDAGLKTRRRKKRFTDHH